MRTGLYLPARLAWRILVHDRPKLIAALLGVLFACVLVFMQLGFRDSLMTSAASAPLRMKGDLFLIHKQTEALWRTVPFDRALLMRALGNSNVSAVYPMYMALGQFKNLDNRTKRTLMVYGFDPSADLLDVPEVKAQRDLIKIKDYVLFDRASRPEFGPVAQQIAAGHDITEINDYKVKIAGTFLMGTSFAADGNIVTSDLNFLRIFSPRLPEKIDLGIVLVKDKKQIPQVHQTLQALMGSEVAVLTFQELIAFEQAYWQNTAPVGFIFGMGVIMGLIVGMVIVYQILFSEISNNISQFATLRAIGYSQGYLVRVVFASAALLAVLGFAPGLGVSLYLYHVAEQNIFIPFPMPPEKIISVFTFILLMCFGAGALAIRKLKSADPADMF